VLKDEILRYAQNDKGGTRLPVSCILIPVKPSSKLPAKSGSKRSWAGEHSENKRPFSD
jgi:hypothetical protein